MALYEPTKKGPLFSPTPIVAAPRALSSLDSYAFDHIERMLVRLHNVSSV